MVIVHEVHAREVWSSRVSVGRAVATIVPSIETMRIAVQAVPNTRYRRRPPFADPTDLHGMGGSPPPSGRRRHAPSSPVGGRVGGGGRRPAADIVATRPGGCGVP